jgi:hypothetical protein
MGISSKLRWPFSQIQKKGGFVTHVDSGSNIRRAGLRHAQTDRPSTLNRIRGQHRSELILCRF